MGPQKLSKKFRYIVVVAFLGSIALAGITLFSFQNFTNVFGAYRKYDVLTQELNKFQALVIKQNYLVAHYVDVPQNKMIRALEENNQLVKGQLQAVFESLEDTDLIPSFKALEAAFQKNTSGLEGLFIADAERVGRQQDILDLYHRIFQYLHYVDQLPLAQKIMQTVSSLAGIIDQPVYAFQKKEALDFDLDFLRSVPALCDKNLTATQRKVLDQLMPILGEFVKQVQEFTQSVEQEKNRAHTFDEVYAATILSAIQQLAQDVEKKQSAIYDTWMSKNALTRHSMEFAALFTLVSLCWLLVGLSQLFSLRR